MKSWACNECGSPLVVMADPWVDPDNGEEFVGLISLCTACVDSERGDAYDQGYSEGYSDGENQPEDKVFELMRRILDDVEDGRTVETHYLTLLKELL